MGGNNMTMTLAFITGGMVGSAVTLLIMSAFVVARRVDEEHHAFQRGYDVGYTHAAQDMTDQ